MRTVTVDLRSLVATAATAVAVLAAYAVGSAQTGTASAVASPGPAPISAATIVMTGTGESTGVPDRLEFSLDVHTRAGDVSTALRSANRATRHVLRAVRAQDVAPKDVQTTGLSLNPTYDYSSDGPPVITGYAVTESMSVLVRSLPDAGATVSAAVDAGGNAVRLHGVRLEIGDQGALLHRARAGAIEDARAKASQYAAAAGRTLGEVTSVREVHVNQSISRAYPRAALDSAVTGSVPIRAGSADLKVSVSVVWSFA